MMPRLRAGLLSISAALAGLAPVAASANECSKALTNLVRPNSRKLKELGIGVFPTSRELKVLDRELIAADGKSLNSLTQNLDAEMSYVIAPDNRLYLVPGSIDLSTDHSWMAEVVLKDGRPWSFPIKEAGAIRFTRTDPNVAVGTFSLERSYGVEISEEEINVFAKQVDDSISKDPALARRLKLRRPVSSAKVLKCSEVFAEGRSAKTFIGSKVLVSSTLLTGGILINHPERFDVLLKGIGLHEEDPSRNYDGDMLFADYTSTAVNSFFQAYVGYQISAKGIKFLESRIGSKVASSFMARGAASMGSVALQSLIYASLTDNDAKGVGLYNIGYSVFSLAKSHYLDEFLYQKLPQVIYNACLVSPALKVVVGQNTVRFVEGFAATTLYLKGREVFVGE